MKKAEAEANADTLAKSEPAAAIKYTSWLSRLFGSVSSSDNSNINNNKARRSTGGTPGSTGFRWRDYLWHCTQTEDELMFVPEGLRHAIINKDPSFAVSVQVDMQIPGGSLLHFTAFHGHDAGSQLLVETGVDVNAKAGNGARPLHLATLLGHVGVVQLLLAAGADPTALDDRGVSPLQLAEYMVAEQPSSSSSRLLAMLEEANTVQAKNKRAKNKNAKKSKKTDTDTQSKTSQRAGTSASVDEL